MAALTNSERQKRFKDNQALKENGARRVEVWLTTAASCALDRLAVHQKTTRRDVIERLLIAEQDRIKESLSDVEYEQFMYGLLPVTRR